MHHRRIYPVSSNLGFCDVVPTHPETKPCYAISVRRPARLPSGFLQTNPHGNALAFGSYFW